jgi:hypothetical protein
MHPVSTNPKTAGRLRQAQRPHRRGGTRAQRRASTRVSESCPSQGSSTGLEVKRRTAGRPARRHKLQARTAEGGAGPQPRASLGGTSLRCACCRNRCRQTETSSRRRPAAPCGPRRHRRPRSSGRRRAADTAGGLYLLPAYAPAAASKSRRGAETAPASGRRPGSRPPPRHRGSRRRSCRQ